MYFGNCQPFQFSARRRYWTSSTFRSSSAKNLVNAVEHKLSSFEGVPAPATGRLPVLLFTISKHLPSELLAQLVHKFQDLVPSFEPIGVLAQDSNFGRFSVSIATWYGSPAELVPFTSTIASRTPIAVGREIIPPRKAHHDSSSTSAHHRLDFSTTDHRGGGHQTDDLSAALEKLPIELRTIQPSSIKSLILFSAPSPQLFLKSLERSFPAANLMGLIGSSTVFQTGRRSTLFRNRSITGEEGAVGIAVLNNSNIPSPSPLISYPGMKTLGSPMQVTGSQGNIILTLNSKKATNCFLEIIERLAPAHLLPTSSDSILAEKKQYYLGFLDNENQISEVSRITGGSVSRGTMSLDREKEIINNCLVQFIHFPENSNILAKKRESNTFQGRKNKVFMEFECIQSSEENQNSQESQAITDRKEKDSVEKIDGLFSAASEFGFIPRHQQIVDINHSKAVLQLF